MGVMPKMSAEDMERVVKLRELVKDDLSEYYDTDFNLLRWLQGHASLSIEEVARLLRKHLKFRASCWNLDSMHTQPRGSHPIHNHWTHGITGEAGEKLPNVIVQIEQCGAIDYHGMMATHSLTEVMKARVPDLEEMLAEVMQMEKRTGEQASILFVMDLSSLKYDSRLYDLVTGSMRALSEFMADHYVELIKFFMVVNVPSFVSALWIAVRPLLPERTKGKVRILSASNWRTESLDYASSDRYPVKWSDDSHSFTAKLPEAVDYPKDGYYAARGLKPPASAIRIDVPAGKTFTETRWLKAGDRVSWYVLAHRNVGFGFAHCPDEHSDDFQSMDQPYPSFDWMPGPFIVPLEDEVTIAEAGCYKLWFSNARSWWTSVGVTYSLQVTPAESTAETA